MPVLGEAIDVEGFLGGFAASPTDGFDLVRIGLKISEDVDEFVDVVAAEAIDAVFQPSVFSVGGDGDDAVAAEHGLGAGAGIGRWVGDVEEDGSVAEEFPVGIKGIEFAVPTYPAKIDSGGFDFLDGVMIAEGRVAAALVGLDDDGARVCVVGGGPFLGRESVEDEAGIWEIPKAVGSGAVADDRMVTD